MKSVISRRLNRVAQAAALALPLALAAGGVSAKTLVYCSEGSPENFARWCGCW